MSVSFQHIPSANSTAAGSASMSHGVWIFEEEGLSFGFI